MCKAAWATYLRQWHSKLGWYAPEKSRPAILTIYLFIISVLYKKDIFYNASLRMYSDSWGEGIVSFCMPRGEDYTAKKRKNDKS